MTRPDPSSEWQQALQTVQPALRRAAAFSLVAGLLVLAPTLYMFEVYDRVLNSRNHQTLLMLTLLVLGATALMEVLEWTRSATLRSCGTALERRLAPSVFRAIYRHALLTSGSARPQPLQDLRTVCDFLGNPAVGALMELPVALVFVAVLAWIHPVLAWAALFGACVQVLLTWLNQRGTQSPIREANLKAMAAQHQVEQSMSNAEVVQAMGMLQNVRRRWHDLQQQSLSLQARGSDHGGWFQAAARFVQSTVASMLLGLGAWLLLRDGLPGGPGMVLVGSVVGGRMLAPLVLMITQWRAVVTALDARTRLLQLLDSLPNDDKPMPLPAPRGALTVEQLAAAAPGTSTPILKGLNFRLQPGEVLGVIGPSAAGKTTLARLLTGLWPATAGKVRLDGVDMHGWNKDELGPHVGYLPQGVALLEGTVAENIGRFGLTDLARVEAAARHVGLHDFIVSLPQGYDTPVGPDGAVLSGGQRQRIGLARAVYGRPVLVVLDEPNASLDEAGDIALAQTIRQLSAQGTTFVVITQRTNVLVVVHKLLVLREGMQHAFGPRDEVLPQLANATQAVRLAKTAPTQGAVPLAAQG
ncbi:type I secretion system permease/ATPase [Hydrogenophaga sp. OTU3427]|uniref:type I secretion system permease/ATPase n=1 Tax=Hydrogenophaga sp. OTU3427 TaxID=3043856 RepID=UPI00313BEB91